MMPLETTRTAAQFIFNDLIVRAHAAARDNREKEAMRLHELAAMIENEYGLAP